MRSIFGNNLGKAVIISICLLFISNAEANPIAKTERANSSLESNLALKIDRQTNSTKSNYLDNNSRDRFLIAQLNSIEQLTDIKPTDWSYQALKNLIERYGCLNGYPNRTYLGNRVLTRAEFVAGLNACLNQIESAYQTAPQTDINTVLRLMQEFQSELAIFQGKTDGSQARLQDLEITQFSTTTKLIGEAIFGLASTLSDDPSNTILGSRLRLELNSSFGGNDLLFTRLSRNDFIGFTSETGTSQGNLAFAEPNSDEDLQLDALRYSFSIGDRLNIILGATGLEADDIASTINFLDGDGGSGAISAFGTRNPIYYTPGDAGLGISHTPIEQIELSAGYIAASASESSPGNGLFDGTYSALGQITVEPWENLSLAATYVHSYQSDAETSGEVTNLQSPTIEFASEVPTVSNSYGLELAWEISDRLVVGGWGGLSKVSNLDTLEGQVDRTKDIWNWAATLALPDLGKEGSLAGVVVGSEPKITNSTNGIEADSDRSLHLEAFYQYQVNDNVSVTPGVVWITEPDSNIQDADDLVIGTVRTTFSF